MADGVNHANDRDALSHMSVDEKGAHFRGEFERQLKSIAMLMDLTRQHGFEASFNLDRDQIGKTRIAALQVAKLY